MAGFAHVAGALHPGFPQSQDYCETQDVHCADVYPGKHAESYLTGTLQMPIRNRVQSMCGDQARDHNAYLVHTDPAAASAAVPNDIHHSPSPRIEALPKEHVHDVCGRSDAHMKSSEGTPRALHEHNPYAAMQSQASLYIDMDAGTVATEKINADQECSRSALATPRRHRLYTESWVKQPPVSGDYTLKAQKMFEGIKFWREVFSALTGMHGVYVLANFAFDNPACGICSLFCFLCSAFAQLDRRAPSYILTAFLTFCLGIIIAVALATPIQGFDAFSSNVLLRRICIGQSCLLILATPAALLLAFRILKLHSLLREPGVLVPLSSDSRSPSPQHSDNVDVAAAEVKDEFRQMPDYNGLLADN